MTNESDFESYKDIFLSLPKPFSLNIAAVASAILDITFHLVPSSVMIASR